MQQHSYFYASRKTRPCLGTLITLNPSFGVFFHVISGIHSWTRARLFRPPLNAYKMWSQLVEQNYIILVFYNVHIQYFNFSYCRISVVVDTTN